MSGFSQETSATEKSMVALLAEILNDGQTLLLQEIQLAKHEIQDEIRKTAAAGAALAAGIGMGLLGAILLVLMLVHLLNAVSELPLWACYAIVGGVLAAAAAVLVMGAIKKFQQIHFVPFRTVETLKENVQWFKEIATSSRT